MLTPRIGSRLFALLLATACGADESRAGSTRDGADADSDFPVGVVVADRDARVAAEPGSDAGTIAAPPDAAGPLVPTDAGVELDAQLAPPDAAAPARDARPLDARSEPLDATNLNDGSHADACQRDCQREDAASADDGCSEPVGPALFEEHFEQDNFMNGEYHGFLLRDPSARVSIDPGTAARPARTLRISRPLAARDAGVSVLSIERGLASIAPRYISYRVRLGALEPAGSALVEIGSAPPEPALALLTMTSGELRVTGSNLRHRFEDDAWLLIQFRDVDWVAHRFDLYVDCRRVGSDVPFDVSVDTLDRLGFANDGVTSYYDDIVIK